LNDTKGGNDAKAIQVKGDAGGDYRNGLVVDERLRQSEQLPE
jgi:hypothetical protein